MKILKRLSKCLIAALWFCMCILTGGIMAKTWDEMLLTPQPLPYIMILIILCVCMVFCIHKVYEEVQ